MGVEMKVTPRFPATQWTQSEEEVEAPVVVVEPSEQAAQATKPVVE